MPLTVISPDRCALGTQGRRGQAAPAPARSGPSALSPQTLPASKGRGFLSSQPCAEAQTGEEMKTPGGADDAGREVPAPPPARSAPRPRLARKT